MGRWVIYANDCRATVKKSKYKGGATEVDDEEEKPEQLGACRTEIVSKRKGEDGQEVLDMDRWKVKTEEVGSKAGGCQKAGVPE